MGMMIRTDWAFLMGQTGGDTPVASNGAAVPTGTAEGTPPALGTDAKAAEGATGTAGETKGEKGMAAPPVGGTAKTQPTGGGMDWMLLVLLGVMFLLLFILPARTRKKQQKKFDEMYKSLKRDDKIMLQNGKFVVVERCEDERIYVWADTDRHVREVYHRNAVAMLATDADKESAKK